MRRHRPSHVPYAKGPASPLSEPATLIRTFNSDSQPSRPVRPSPLTRSGIEDMPLDMLDRIRSFPLFASAPESFLAAVGSHLRPQSHAPHDYILTEGDDAKAMYWLVRGAVGVTSRDGESTHAELKPGAFFGEIGVLMGIPRTATIVARTKCLLVVLKKEDLAEELPKFPEVEKTIREEAQERLSILERKKKESQILRGKQLAALGMRGEKRAYDDGPDLEPSSVPGMRTRSNSTTGHKKRKSPSPGVVEVETSTALGSGLVHIRQLLLELPIFAGLPSDALHFLGSNAIQRTYPPFTDIIKQNSEGRDVYFIVRGEVEVVDEKGATGSMKLTNAAGRTIQSGIQVKARLRQGNYFGEVASLALAPRRTATVRSVSLVECLLITGNILTNFWRSCPPRIREQVEQTARQRLESSPDQDVAMTDADENVAPLTVQQRLRGKRASMSRNKVQKPELPKPKPLEGCKVAEPVDPDPYLNKDLDNVRMRARRPAGASASVKSELPLANGDQGAAGASKLQPSPLRPKLVPATQIAKATKPKRIKAAPARPKPQAHDQQQQQQQQHNKGPFPNSVLVHIFSHLELHNLMRLRLVCAHWSKTLKEAPELCRHLDLSAYNRRVTDDALSTGIAPFAGSRPRFVDLSNCFHVTDAGFAALAARCGTRATAWRMKSVWDVSAAAIHQMVQTARELEEVDLSNCRKVNDALLMHVIGNVPLPPTDNTPRGSFSEAGGIHGPAAAQRALASRNSNRPSPATPTSPPQHHSPAPNALAQQSQQQSQPHHPPPVHQAPAPGGPASPGTPNSAPPILGSPHLRRLTLSYCKHVTDRSMAHLAAFARRRLEAIDLTRCTTITDHGFEAWGQHQFERLQKVTLADCTYLTDHAIMFLSYAARETLRYLDLVRHHIFCSHLPFLFRPFPWREKIANVWWR